jgi:hypothetical protein
MRCVNGLLARRERFDFDEQFVTGIEESERQVALSVTVSMPLGFLFIVPLVPSVCSMLFGRGRGHRGRGTFTADGQQHEDGNDAKGLSFHCLSPEIK